MTKKLSLKERGEDAAAAYIERVGMAVIERNYECDEGTIAVVAREGDTLVLVDVVTRTTTGKRVSGLVSKSRLGRMRRIAKAYVQQPDLRELQVRYDAIDLLVISEDRALLRHHRAVL